MNPKVIGSEMLFLTILVKNKQTKKNPHKPQRIKIKLILALYCKNKNQRARKAIKRIKPKLKSNLNYYEDFSILYNLCQN